MNTCSPYMIPISTEVFACFSFPISYFMDDVLQHVWLGVFLFFLTCLLIARVLYTCFSMCTSAGHDHMPCWLSTFVPGIASSISSDGMKSLLLKPAGSIASVILTGNRVIVNGLCVLLNISCIGGSCGSPPSLRL